MVSTMEDQRKALALKLYQISAFKFGEFTLKSGEKSPVYFDLRVIISHPDVLHELTNFMQTFIEEKGIQCDRLCGVPYTGVPIASFLSSKTMQPMIIRRKEAKTYGSKDHIMGKYQPDEKCLIIEDVVTTGSSIIETVVDLRKDQLVVEDAIVVVDREQGGVSNIENNGIKMHSLFTLGYLLETLKSAGKLKPAVVKSVNEYIAKSQIKLQNIPEKPARITMTFADRAKVAKNEVSRALLKIMDLKKTNLCLAADLSSSEEIFNVIEAVGPFICLLKTHVDIVKDFNQNFVKTIQNLAEKYNFLIMEDRKFADIGNTVGLQYSEGIYEISSWADLVTVHSLPGEGVLKGLKAAVSGLSPRGVFLLAEMSSEGNLITSDYKEKTIKMCAAHSDFVAGVVAQSIDLVQDPGLIQLTPGVKLEEGGDNLGQKYNTPEYVMKEKGADIAVVGRGIISSKNPGEVAKTYRDRLWEAYLARIN